MGGCKVLGWGVWFYHRQINHRDWKRMTSSHSNQYNNKILAVQRNYSWKSNYFMGRECLVDKYWLV